MAALMEAANLREYPASIDLVISDKADAGGLEIAKSYNIQCVALERSQFDSRTSHEESILNVLEEASPDYICLAGFMRVLSADFVRRFIGRIINIHPSLLPAFKGLDTHQRALDAGAKIHGCSVHHVTEGLDDGPIIAQAAIPIEADDTAETLAQRLINIEHKLYVDALRQLIEEDRNENAN